MAEKKVYEKTAEVIRESVGVSREDLKKAYEVVTEIKNAIVAHKAGKVSIPPEIWKILTKEQIEKINKMSEGNLTESEKRQALACINFSQRLLRELLNK